MADEEEAGEGGEGGGDDAYDPQRALVAQSLEVNKLRQHVEVLKRANERIRDQYKQEIRSLLQPLIERHRKLQVENSKLQEKIEKLSVAPPGSDEALVEELRKLRHDHGILQKITEGLEADSRLARRLQAELEETQQRMEALDVRVNDLERERRRLEMLVSERDQTRVELDEALEKAQAEQKEWKEKYEKAQQAHKDELRGYQQQLGEAIGRYKGLEKQHQDALFARDLLPILYEELQAEAATYDELTALFNGARGNPDAYRPADHDMAAPAPVIAETSFSSYQPSEGATIALAAGTLAAGLASSAHELDDFGMGDEAAPVASATLSDDQVTTEADMVGALVDPLDDLNLDDGLALGDASLEIGETTLDDTLTEPGLGDLEVMAADLAEPETGFDFGAPAPQAADDALDRMALGDLGLSADELAVLNTITGSPEAATAPDFTTEAMHTGYDLAVESEQLAADDDILALDDDVLESAEAPEAMPFDVSGFSFGEPAAAAPATEVLAAEDDLGDYLAAFEQEQAAPVVDEEPAVLPADVLEMDEEPAVLPADVLEMDDEPAVQSVDVLEMDDEPAVQSVDVLEMDEEPAVLPVDVLEMDDEPLVLGTTGFDEELAEQAAGVHSGLAHPITDMPGLAIDEAATEDEVAERTLIDRDQWEIDDGGETVTLGETGETTENGAAEETFDFAAQLAQSLGGFADTSEDDVEEVIWEDGPIDEIAEEAHATGGVMFAPGALSATPAPAFDPEAEDEDSDDLVLPALESEAEEAQGAPSLDLGLGWPAGGPEAAEAADELLPSSWGDMPAQDPQTEAGSWAAAMATEAGGLKHSETGISPEEIARLLDDDDDLSAGMAPSVDADSPEFRIQPPKLEPPPLP
jgi:hypothetical protein